MIGLWTKSANHSFVTGCVIVYAWAGKRPWRSALLLRHLILQWLCLSGKGHCGAPPLSHHLQFAESKSVQIQTDLSISLVPRQSPWKIQSDLPHPSLLKSARASPVRSPLAFSRSPLDTLLSGFLPLFLILDDVHLAKSIPGSPRLVGLLAVLLIRHLLVLLHLLSGWASLHFGEELLRGSWEDSTVRFTCFTKSWVGQVACALQPTGMR